MPISEGYGREGDRWYVNSAQSWSKDKVDDWFQEEMDERGSVPVGYIETLVGSADLVGRWAILSHIEGKGKRRGTARKIMRDYPMSIVKEVQYTWKRSLDAYLDAREAAIREGQLQRAAHLNENGPWTWYLAGPTDPSSGSIL